MSDRAPITLTVYECPREALPTLFEVLDEYRLSESGFSDEVPDEITLGDPIMEDDVDLGSDDEIATKLIEAGVSFDVFQDAKYEYDGSGLVHMAGVGTYGYTGGGSGEAMILVADLDALVAEHRRPSQMDDLRAALDKLTGRLVRAAQRERAHALEHNILTKTLRRPAEEQDDDDAAPQG